MGFYSWKCAVSGESIATRYSGKPIEQSACVLVTPNKIYREESYEGFGEFNGVDVYALLGDGDRDVGIDRYFDIPEELPFKIKLVLQKYYQGQTYEELTESESCEYQGYFY